MGRFGTVDAATCGDPRRESSQPRQRAGRYALSARVHRKAGLVMTNAPACCGTYAYTLAIAADCWNGQEQTKTHSENHSQTARSRAIEISSLNSLSSRSSQRSYDHAIREFIDWYCSEPRLAFNKTVVTRLSNMPRTGPLRVLHNQLAPRGNSQAGIRGGGLWPAEPRSCRRNPKGKRSEEAWHAHWKLVDC